MIIKASERTSYEFSAMMPIFTPYYNQWGKNVYWQSSAFDHDPFTLNASSTSGSPVVIAGNKFFGFLNRSGGRFAFDGVSKLTVTLEPGQELLIDELCDPWAKMGEYNRMILGDEQIVEQPFWSALEYCTWVEQTKTAMLSASRNYDVINEKFVYDYMKKLDALGLPKHGKLTIDDGWAVNKNAAGQYFTGDWEIDRAKFPNFERLIEDIASEGFVPGLWFSPFNISRDCELAKAHPELIGAPSISQNRFDLRYSPEHEPIIREFYKKLFTPYLQMGIRKLKLDISYGRKDDMIDLFRILREEVKAIDPTVELEGHMPDVFASKYADTVRLNDVSIYPHENWKYTTEGHFLVCRYCSERILNLDHLGGNNPQCYASLFLEHCNMLLEYSRLKRGYPVVSMLPDIYAPAIREKFVSIVNEFGC